MKSILIVVDMQNGFNRYEQTHLLADKISKLTNGGFFDSIIATRFINREGSQYTRFLDWHRLIYSPDIDLIEGISVDKIVDKFVYTCVNEEFLSLLKELNDGNLPPLVFICGADTDCCVLKIATDVFERGLVPVVLSKYCDSNGGLESHEAGLLVMKRLIGKKNIVDDIIQCKKDVDRIIEEHRGMLEA